MSLCRKLIKTNFDVNDYEEKIRREQQWHQHEGFAQGHFLNSRLFYSHDRVVFNSKFSKTNYSKFIRQVLEKDNLTNPRMLIAPTGAGNDLPWLTPLSNRITGVDISDKALEAIPDANIEKHVADIKHMTMFKDGQFDVVIMSQFFHHYLNFDFDDFLREGLRVLRPGGHFFAYEPSILHPVAMTARGIKKIFGNITGDVEDEAPFYPGRLTVAMKRGGFKDVTFWATSYSHQRLPVPLARVINATTYPLLRAPVFKYFGLACLFYGRKP